MERSIFSMTRHRMVRLLLGLRLLLVTPAVLAAQNEPIARDSNRVLVLDHHFGPDSNDSVMVTLARQVVYWAVVTGPGTPAFQPVHPGARPALVLLVDSTTSRGRRRFEVHAFHAGPHLATLADLPGGASATLRLYQDVVETQRIAEKRDRQLAVGLLFAAGFHSGYRLDPTGGADPRGGVDFEACLLAETGNRFSTCLGAGRQTFPDAFSVTWLFIEERGRVGTSGLAGRRIDFGATLRFSYAPGVGPRRLTASVLGIGLYVSQHLAAAGRRHGLSVFCAWQHGRLGYAPETERLDSDRFTAGITWVP